MGSRLTVCVTCVWADVDSVWEQGKLEATLREMLAAGAARPTGSPTRQVHAVFGGFMHVKFVCKKDSGGHLLICYCWSECFRHQTKS